MKFKNVQMPDLTLFFTPSPKGKVENAEKLLEPDTCELGMPEPAPAKPTDPAASKPAAPAAQPAKVSLTKPTAAVPVAGKPTKPKNLTGISATQTRNRNNTMDFHLRRRQQFLSEDYFVFYRDWMMESIQYWQDNVPAGHGSEVAGRASAFRLAARTNADLFLLRYTAGESLVALRADLTSVIELYEESASRIRAECGSDDAAPLLLDELEDYERTMQLIGLCILFHRTDLLPRVAAMFDGTNAGDDALYEDVLSYYLEERYDVDELLHQKPYRHLLKSLRDESNKSAADVEKYLKLWYVAMKELTWHDSHLDLTENGPGYHGYWAIEAGAVAYLLEIDDRAVRDNIVYPKDLVDFARAFDAESLAEFATDQSQLRVPGGEACPRSGYWTTPAAQDVRRHFNAGDVMPIFEGASYGATIWQWSDQQ